MARLTIVIPDDVTKELRIRAVEVYDGEKGALGKAVTGRYPYLVKAAAFSEEKIAVVSRNISRRPRGFKSHPSRTYSSRPSQMNATQAREALYSHGLDSPSFNSEVSSRRWDDATIRVVHFEIRPRSPLVRRYSQEDLRRAKPSPQFFLPRSFRVHFPQLVVLHSTSLL